MELFILNSLNFNKRYLPEGYLPVASIVLEFVAPNILNGSNSSSNSNNLEKISDVDYSPSQQRQNQIDLNISNNSSILVKDSTADVVTAQSVNIAPLLYYEVQVGLKGMDSQRLIFILFYYSCIFFHVF